jgi:hypothetical protein
LSRTERGLANKEKDMTTRASLVTACLVAFGLVAGSAALRAAPSAANRLTYLTFSGPIALPGVTLAAGTYAFEIVSPDSPTVVLVRNQSRTQVFYMGMTQRVARPAGAPPDMQVRLGEARRGEATPLVAWFPVDMSDGRQFIYTR